MNNGWIKLHRSFLDWEWYDDNKTFKLFIHLLLMANHEEKKYRGEVIKRGQVMTGVSLLAEQTKLSVKSVRTSLNKLKRTNEVAIETSPQGSIIQIVNYDKYQTVANETANEGQTKGKQRATNKKEKKEKNNIPSLQIFKDYATEICTEYDWYVDPIEVELKYQAWRDNDWHNGLDKPIKNWKTSLRNTLKYMKQDKSEEQYVPKYLLDIKEMTTK